MPTPLLLTVGRGPQASAIHAPPFAFENVAKSPSSLGRNLPVQIFNTSSREVCTRKASTTNTVRQRSGRYLWELTKAALKDDYYRQLRFRFKASGPASLRAMRVRFKVYGQVACLMSLELYIIRANEREKGSSPQADKSERGGLQQPILQSIFGRMSFEIYTIRANRYR